MTTLTSRGLEDVVACTSAICAIDGQRGRLQYGGYDIDELVQAGFEEVCYLLWHGELPDRAQLEALRAALDAVELPEAVVTLLRGLPRDAHPLTALRTAISALGALDPEAEDGSPEANTRKAVRLVAQTPRIVAAWQRLRNGLEPVMPEPGDSIAQGFLRGLSGKAPSADAVRAIDMALVLHAEHELNASTFAVRVAAATETDLHAAITAACAVLKGPKHGGANEDVPVMLDEIGTPAAAEAWVKAKLAWRETLPVAERQQIKARFSGFGHRVYKVDDPRAAHLRRMAQRLAEGDPTVARRLAIAERVRELMAAEKGLKVNVDFYSALVYQALGIPSDLNTSIFAIARMAGWTAHALEQYADNRLIRPRAEYIGSSERRFMPLAARG
ncbi:MAG TPA: citrate/2-methylcitrate synthase [Dehalococcoidia bacterium]|jgi:citrate synthase|nr:citrate/2-methylcitrate synthase [Dehalococcoidia bacterium]